MDSEYHLPFPGRIVSSYALYESLHFEPDFKHSKRLMPFYNTYRPNNALSRSVNFRTVTVKSYRPSMQYFEDLPRTSRNVGIY